MLPTSARLREADIPMIAIDIPHPGATYYGANNYEAGLIGGRYLGRWVKEQIRQRINAATNRWNASE